jgi:hypothetical protein
MTQQAQPNYVTRFSATERGGLPMAPELMAQLTDPAARATRHQALIYELARHGVAPVVLPPDDKIDVTPPTTAGTANSVWIETGPAADGGKPNRAVAHLMPRSEATLNLELGGDESPTNPDTPQGEGRSFEIVNAGDGVPIIGKDGVLRELIIALPKDEIEALDRLAVHFRDQP